MLVIEVGSIKSGNAIKGYPLATHKQKYTRGAVGHMFRHYDRSKEVPGLKSPGNTVLNYNLASNDQPKSQLDFLHQRLSEVKVHNRKDVNVMVDWIVTLPQSLNDKGLENEDRFFKESKEKSVLLEFSI